MSRIWFVAIAAGLILLGVTGTASAAVPVCAPDPALYELPAGLTWLNPRAPCTDADGDAITVQVVDPPDHGTLAPGGAQPIDAKRFYTANADAAGMRDSMKFVAVANGEQSNEFQVDVWILPAHSAPVCKDLAVAVQAGSSVAIAPACVDPDGDAFTVSMRDAPTHGTYDPARRTYTAAARFAGRDSMTFAVVDEWHLAARPPKVTITVTPKPGQRALTGDKAAPRLKLVARSPLRSRALRRGLRLTATASEPGRIVIEALVSRATAQDLGIDTHVGSLARDIGAGKTSLRLKLDRDARSRLATLKRVKLKLVARLVDDAGNLRTKRLRVKISNH